MKFLRAQISECGSHIEDYDKIYNLFAARYQFHINCYTLPQYLLRDYIMNLAVQEVQPKINNVLIVDINANVMPEFLQITDNNVLKLVKNSVLRYETKFQRVEQLEKEETTSAAVKVESGWKYMPNKERISFYGDVSLKNS